MPPHTQATFKSPTSLGLRTLPALTKVFCFILHTFASWPILINIVTNIADGFFRTILATCYHTTTLPFTNYENNDVKDDNEYQQKIRSHHSEVILGTHLGPDADR